MDCGCGNDGAGGLGTRKPLPSRGGVGVGPSIQRQFDFTHDPVGLEEFGEGLAIIGPVQHAVAIVELLDLGRSRIAV